MAPRQRAIGIRQIVVRLTFVTIVGTAFLFAVMIGANYVTITSYDAAFSRLAAGDSYDRIVEIMGPPHEKHRSSLKVGVDEYVYRGYPLLFRMHTKDAAVFPRWRIIVDQTNRVVVARRDDHGC